MTTLPDNEIRSRLAARELILDGNPSQIGSACYELRMGSIYYDLTENGKRIDASKMGNILIKPGHRVVLITQEQLCIPNDIIARVTSKGSLFSIGLSPVCTYADPGFSGNLGLVTQNLGDKYIEIPIGEPVAKVDFSLLSAPVDNPYRGQHGFHTRIWPIKNHLQKSYEDVKTDPRVDSEEAESFRILPAATAKTIRHLQGRQRWVDLAILAGIFINTLTIAFAIGDPKGVAAAIVVNIVSSALIGMFTWMYRIKE